MNGLRKSRDSAIFFSMDLPEEPESSMINSHINFMKIYEFQYDMI